jgi:hypothetical protein
VSATIGRDDVVDFVVGNRRPYAVHFNFVVVGSRKESPASNISGVDGKPAVPSRCRDFSV